jgi:hypothetical protein
MMKHVPVLRHRFNELEFVDSKYQLYWGHSQEDV